MQRVVVLGSLNMDLSIACGRMPQAGETLSGGGFMMTPGGKGANQAVAAARAGAPTLLVGAVGSDVFGSQLLGGLDAAGVCCDHVRRVANTTTGVAVIVRTEGDNRIVLDAGANAVSHADDLAAVLDAARPGDVLLTQLECDHEEAFAALRTAHDRGMFTAFNPSPVADIPRDVWRFVDLVCLNETECARICGVMPTGECEVREAVAALHELGIRVVALTLGAQGSVLSADGVLHHAIPPQVEVRDTTCAGDTYLGTLVAAHARGLTWGQALTRANVASALATTRVGAQASIPDVAAVDALLHEQST